MSGETDLELDTFRAEVRAFLADNLPSDMADRNKRAVHQSREDILGWTAILARRGWSVPKWPVEYGGTGWSARKLAVFEEELDLAGAPGANIQGVSLVGPVIYTYGGQAQKDRYLPRIRAGDEFWSQGFSEPNSGSDLASLRTRAVREGDHYVINGQKIWTSESMFADMCFVLCRTDPGVKQQLGISFILVPLTAPGVTVRPIRSIDEGESLCEVFFENVRVPVDNLVGQEGKGWDYAKFLLANERTATAEVPRNKRLLARLKQIAAQEAGPGGGALIDDALFRHHVAELEIDLLSLEAGVARVIDGDANPLLPSILKVQGCELLQALQKAQVEALGSYGVAYFPQGHDAPGVAQEPSAPSHGRDVVADFLFRRAATIYGGSNEIQKNIVSKVLFASGPPGNGAPLEEDEAILAGSVTRFLERAYTFELRQAMRVEGAPALARNWRAFAEMGWLGVAVSSARGGIGDGLGAAALLLEAFGRALVLEPFLHCAVLAARIIETVAPRHADALTQRLMSGESIFAVAHDEPSARGQTGHVAASAAQAGEGFRLNGRKCVVYGGQIATHFLVSATWEGEIGLFLVARDAPGLALKPYRLIDGQRVVDLDLNDVTVEARARLDDGGAGAGIAACVDEAILCASAEAVGAMGESLRITRDYLLVRKQFGAPLATFQALQHRLAEMYARLEQARAMVAMALGKAPSLAPGDRRRLANAVKAVVGRSAFFVGAQAVQLHGGIGMTEEYSIGHFFKRLMTFEPMFGNIRFHTEEFAASSRAGARS